MTVPSPAAEDTELVLEALELSSDENGRKVEARGSVRAVYGTDVLTAERATADLDTAEIVAEGAVTLTRGAETIRGERVRYNWETREGRAEQARTITRGVIVSARELTTSARQSEARGASATTCDRPRPHYRITARRITVYPGRRLVARGASIWLLQHRLFTVPRHEISLRPGEEGSESPFPSIGFNRRDGLLIRKELTLVDRPSLIVDLDASVAFRRGPLGGVRAIGPGKPAWIAALTYREDAPNQRVRFLEVNRLPEVGVVVGGPDRRRRPRRVPTAAQSVRVTLPEEQAPRWEWASQATIGFFRQRRPISGDDGAFDRDGGRLDVRALAARRHIRLGPVRLGSVRLLARTSWYDTGERFTILGLGAGSAWRLGKPLRLSLQRFVHATDGSTPFRFDAPDIRNEWRPEALLTFGATSLGWLGRYDSARGSFFDQEFAVARIFHCLQPRISYRTRRRQWGFDLRIVGLQTGGSSATPDDAP